MWKFENDQQDYVQEVLISASSKQVGIDLYNTIYVALLCVFLDNC